ncbi:MAG: serine protease [Planctomycetes bacterium]|nr:serine protease [Planctomycetota bacterium]
MRLLFSFALLIFSSAVMAAEPTPGLRIAGNMTYPAHSLVRLRAEGHDPKAGILWRIYPSANVQRATTARNLLEFAAPPGSYEVELLAIVTGMDGDLKIEESKQTIIVGPTLPDPKPMPPAPLPPTEGKLDPINALGRIRFGNAGCTATIVGPRRSDGKWDVLTAAHCVSGESQRGTLTLKDGRSFAIRVVAYHKSPDLAWCVTEEAVADLPYAKLAEKNPDPNTAIWHMGFGVDKPGNREDGSVTDRENGDGQLRMSLSVSSGDSGGGIFRADTSELISVVCCTSGMGRKVSMWGGSAESARRTRPKPADNEQLWSPLPIPIQPEAKPSHKIGWKPRPIPIRPDVPQGGES